MASPRPPVELDEWVSGFGVTLTEAIDQVGRALSAVVPPRSVSEGSNVVVQGILTFTTPLARQKGARALVAAREIANRLVQARAEAIVEQASRRKLDFVADPGRILEPQIDNEVHGAASGRSGKASVLRLAGNACPAVGPDAVPKQNLHMGLNCRSSYRVAASQTAKLTIFHEFPMTQSAVRAFVGKGGSSSREYIREYPNTVRCDLEMHPDTSDPVSMA